MTTSLRYLLVIGCLLSLGSACHDQEQSSVNSVKIQLADRTPAIVIRKKTETGTNFVKQHQLFTQCNVDIVLGSRFDPSTDEFAIGDPNCDRYGTYNENPWLKLPFVPNTAFYADGEVRRAYPIGQSYDTDPEVQLEVKTCYQMRNAGDTTSTSSCLEENNNFFADEVAGNSPQIATTRISTAIAESLKFLIYADSGLNRCYEESLAQTDRIEAKVLEPELGEESMFRFLRRKSPLREDLAYMRQQIAKFKPADRALYENRLLLAARLGYTYSDENVSGNLAYEPFGIGALAAFEASAQQRLVAFGDQAATLATMSQPETLLKNVLEFLGESKGTYFLDGTGYPQNLSDLPEDSYSAQRGLINAKFVPLYTDLIYRGVLLAKASNLDPLNYIKKFQTTADLNSCDDYARYRPGLRTKRDQLLAPVLLAANEEPKTGFLEGQWKVAFKDSFGSNYENDKPFVVNKTLTLAADRLQCTPTETNPNGYCDMKWAPLSATADRYDSLKITVKNVYHTPHLIMTKTLKLPSADRIYLSGSDIHQLVKDDFFLLNEAPPILYVEGIKGNVQELVFSTALTFVQNICFDGENVSQLTATDEIFKLAPLPCGYGSDGTGTLDIEPSDPVEFIARFQKAASFAMRPAPFGLNIKDSSQIKSFATTTASSETPISVLSLEKISAFLQAPLPQGYGLAGSDELGRTASLMIEDILPIDYSKFQQLAEFAMAPLPYGMEIADPQGIRSQIYVLSDPQLFNIDAFKKMALFAQTPLPNGMGLTDKETIRQIASNAGFGSEFNFEAFVKRAKFAQTPLPEGMGWTDEEIIRREGLNAAHGMELNYEAFVKRAKFAQTPLPEGMGWTDEEIIRREGLNAAHGMELNYEAFVKRARFAQTPLPDGMGLTDEEIIRREAFNAAYGMELNYEAFVKMARFAQSPLPEGLGLTDKDRIRSEAFNFAYLDERKFGFDDFVRYAKFLKTPLPEGAGFTVDEEIRMQALNLANDGSEFDVKKFIEEARIQFPQGYPGNGREVFNLIVTLMN